MKKIAYAKQEGKGTLILSAEKVCESVDEMPEFSNRLYTVHFMQDGLWDESNLDEEIHTYRLLTRALESFRALLNEKGFEKVYLCSDFEDYVEFFSNLHPRYITI